MQYHSLSLVIFILRSILSDMRITTPAFFFFSFAWNILFHPLTFSLYVSWGLKGVSCRQHIYGPCFCIHSASLCLFVETFNPLTFKVIIDIYLPIAFFLIGVDFIDLFSSLIFLDYISPLTFVVKLIWWYWILLTFACLKSFWILHEFWSRFLSGRIILVADFSFSLL